MTDIPVPTETLRIPGLAAPAEIAIDASGIPHLRAGSLPDLFFLQGFNAARDRLWQIDTWRKRGLGLLAAELGPGYAAQDEASRLLLYRGDLDAEFAAYAPDAREICEAFVCGINAYVDLVAREPERLPPEFEALGTRPARWEAADVVRIRSHTLTRNVLSEIVRANLLAIGGDEAGETADRLRMRREPDIATERPDGLDFADVPLEVARIFKLATAPVTFSRARLDARPDEAERWSDVTPLGEVIARQAGEGSNNWAIAGTRTATGRPILASDPHRRYQLPSLRYLVHLTAPGFDAIGAGEPCVPGISLGHNGTIAFGITIHCTDQEDLYVYETHPDDPELYRYGDGWERMRIVEEEIAVRGAAPRIARLRFTRHGPVLHADPARRRAFALRTVWTHPGSAAYLAALSAMRAQDRETFRESLRGWGAPATNVVYADVTGAIAWFAVGHTPIRPNWSGLTPVPGDGRFEWAGFRPLEEMPSSLDPQAGFVASANEMNLPDDFLARADPTGREWFEPSRAQRIREVLDGAAAHALEDSCALQSDVLCLPARRLAPRLAALDPGDDADAARALALLAGWDHRMDAASAGAALYELWLARHLKPALLAARVPDPKLRALIAPMDTRALLDEAEIASDDVWRETLAAAWRDAAGRMGADPGTWAWGRLHRLEYVHPLANLRSEGLAGEALATARLGPYPTSGNSSTPMLATYDEANFSVIMGSHVRLVIDVGDFDASLCMNDPGQSGDPRSPHFGDLAEDRGAGRYRPLPYGRAAVDAATIRLLRLEPG